MRLVLRTVPHTRSCRVNVEMMVPSPSTARPGLRETREQRGELLPFRRREIGERALDGGAPVVEQGRQGRATRVGDDEDAAPRVSRVDIAAHLTRIDRRLYEPARPRLVDADRRCELAHRARAVFGEHHEQPHGGVTTAPPGRTAPAGRTGPATPAAIVVPMRAGRTVMAVAVVASVAVETSVASVAVVATAAACARAPWAAAERTGTPTERGRWAAPAKGAECGLDCRDRLRWRLAGVIRTCGFAESALTRRVHTCHCTYTCHTTCNNKDRASRAGRRWRTGKGHQP